MPKKLFYPPTALYVHIPWCVRKCPYCDFNSHEAKNEIPEQEYVQALLTDLEKDVAQFGPRELVSIFIGGGTPSLFSPESIERLLLGIKEQCGCKPGIEITMEANPGTVERERFAEFRDAGINRLSIGIQSFQDTFLEKLGRIHSGREAIRAAEAAHDAGFNSFNLDLMFGLPGQVPEDAKRDLHDAIALEPKHLSWYQLTLEPNTLFYHSPPVLPDDEVLWTIQQEGQALLASNEYYQYEVSAYAREGFECVHNRNYWEFGDYFGVGAGAHGKLSLPDENEILRTRKKRHPREYHAAVFQDSDRVTIERVEKAGRPLEFMMNALRLNHGFPLELFEQRTGMALSAVMPEIELAVQRELLRLDDRQVCPTELGRQYLNDLLGLFME